MIKKLIFNDVKNNRLMSAASVFFMTASALLLALAVILFADLMEAVGKSAERANTPNPITISLLYIKSIKNQH